MSERIQYVLIGVACGLLVNLLRDAVQQWRQENVRRERIRKYLMVIKGDLEDRINLVISHCDDGGVKFTTYKGLAENPQMIEAELAERTAVYRTHSAMLLEIPERVSIALSQHYLYGHRKLAGRQEANQNIATFKNSIRELIGHVSEAAASAGPIAFLRWLPKWILGTA